MLAKKERLFVKSLNSGCQNISIATHSFRTDFHFQEGFPMVNFAG